MFKRPSFAGLFLRESTEVPLPQEAAGKSNSTIAKMLEPHLKAVGIKLVQADPFKQKGVIWSVESSQFLDQVVCLCFGARARGGRGVGKERMLSLSFSVRNKDGSLFNPEKMNRADSIAAISYEGAGNIYKERIA